jgi:hypothetical protein
MPVGRRSSLRTTAESRPAHTWRMRKPHAVRVDLIDLVLGDLERRDGMFVGRRDDESAPDVVVIQTGEDGRHCLRAPTGSPEELMRFMASAQALVSADLGQSVPKCPEHDHVLRPVLAEAEVGWECPDGGWRCRLGDYDERSWPANLEAGGMAAALCARLGRRGIQGWAQIGVESHNGEPVAQVGLRAADPAVIAAISEAAKPMRVVFELADWPEFRRC